MSPNYDTVINHIFYKDPENKITYYKNIWVQFWETRWFTICLKHKDNIYFQNNSTYNIFNKYSPKKKGYFHTTKNF